MSARCAASAGHTVVGWAPGIDLGGEGVRYVRMQWGSKDESEGYPFLDMTGRYIDIVDPFELLSMAAYTKPCPWIVANGMALGALIGSYQKGPCVGKLQLGSAWWFNDHLGGMRAQLETLAELGCLGNFVGMLTDSRSFLSYTRHEYFRRILCQFLGEKVARGEIPADLKWLGKIVEDISYFNAKRYFGF